MINEEYRQTVDLDRMSPDIAPLYNSIFSARSFSMSDTSSLGDTLGPYLQKGVPFLSHRNLVKFHKPRVFVRDPGSFCFNHWNKGMVSSPTIFTLLKISKVTP